MHTAHAPATSTAPARPCAGSRWRSALWLVAALPALACAAMIVRYGVDLPRMDELASIGPFVVEVAQGRFEPANLLVQANESRPAVPRLIGLVGAWLTGWDTRYEMWLTYACMVLNLAMLIVLFRRAARLANLAIAHWAPLLAAGAGLVIFSPFQTELIWGFQYITHIPITCLLIAAVVAGTPFYVVERHLFCLALCLIATFSYANGMVLWVLVPFLLAAEGCYRGRRAWYAVVWMLIAGLAVAAYFHGYTKPAQHPSFTAFRGHEKQALMTFLSFFGAPLVRDSVPGAALVGAGVLFAWCASISYALRRHGMRGILLLAPCLAVLAYAVASDLVTTLGRFGFGPGALMATRYAAFNTYVIGAAFFVVPLAFAGIAFSPTRARIVRWCAIHMVAAYVAAWGISFQWHLRIMKDSWAHVTRARAATPFLEQMPVPNHAGLPLYYPAVKHVTPLARSLRKLGYMRPAAISTQDYEHAFHRPPGGYTDSITWQGKVVTTAGWAFLPSSGRCADAIVATQKQEDGQRQVLGVAFVSGARPDVAQALGTSDAVWSAWSAQVYAPGSGEVEMWAVNGVSGKLYRLPPSGGAK